MICAEFNDLQKTEKFIIQLLALFTKSKDNIIRLSVLKFLVYFI